MMNLFHYSRLFFIINFISITHIFPTSFIRPLLDPLRLTDEELNEKMNVRHNNGNRLNRIMSTQMS